MIIYVHIHTYIYIYIHIGKMDPHSSQALHCITSNICAPPAAPLGEDRQSAWGLPVHRWISGFYISWDLWRFIQSIPQRKVVWVDQCLTCILVFDRSSRVIFEWGICSSKSLVLIVGAKWCLRIQGIPGISGIPLGLALKLQATPKKRQPGLQRWSGSLQQSHESSGHSHLRQTWNQAVGQRNATKKHGKVRSGMEWAERLPYFQAEAHTE